MQKDRFTTDQARSIGEAIGIDWDASPFDVEQFRTGLGVELEHGRHDVATNVTDDDEQITAKIALAHLNEFPDYYTRLERMEAEAERYWSERAPNISDPIFDEPRERPGFRCRRARLSRQAGGERLGLSLWELPPGEAAYPYHYHLVEEELIVVLAGKPSLRTREGWRELEEGQVVSFLRGEGGAHQLVNRTKDTVRFLSSSTSGEPDIVLYPDSGKLGAAERLPSGEGIRAFFRLADAVDYYEGELPPGS